MLKKNLSYIISRDFQSIKLSSNKNTLKDTIEGLLNIKIDFNQDIMKTLRNIYDHEKDEPSKKIKEILLMIYNKPYNAIGVIIVFLLIIYIILSFFNKDVSKITPLFNLISNVTNSIFCK